MTFEFATAARIVFGAGKRTEVFCIAAQLGRRALIVTGRNSSRANWLRAGLEAAGLSCELFANEGEPKIGDAVNGATLACETRADLVIGIGGGSAMDLAKAVAALATNTLPVLEYLEVIGQGRSLQNAPLPIVAVPTTAGTGAEVTRNAVLASPGHQVKVSLRSPKMLPACAVVDPELTYDLPRGLTASTGLDALTQLIEPFLCTRANPMTDALCREALPRVARSLPAAFRRGGDQLARAEMCLASVFGGLALANAGLGAVHGFAAPIGGMFDAPHGAICAALLPEVLEVNWDAIKRREPNANALERFDELGVLLTGRPNAGAQDAIEFVRELRAELNVPALRTYGVGPQSFAALVERAAAASSMKANPIQLSPAELGEILERAS